VNLLAGYWRKQFDELTTQAEEVRNRLFGFSAAKPKTPVPSPQSGLHESAEKSITRLQKGQSPTARDSATARLKLNSDTLKVEAPPFAAGTAETGARVSNEGQLRSGKESTAKERSTRLQRTESTSHHPAQRREQKPQAVKTKLRARPSSDPDRERPSRTQEPIPQNLPSDLKFGMLDGNPVRFTNLEAWWLIDGAWRPISPGEVLSNAVVMREVRFKQLFPLVPLLPSNAFGRRRSSQGRRSEANR
jgi:hypothetical protein